ncbi:MAG: carbon monoxide dehydrogenase subunit G [Pseudomonadota bacterium]
MNFEGQHRISAPIDKVWDALNDPVILAECIPGCKSLQADDANHFSAVIQLKIGPLNAKFDGTVRLEALDPPHRCTIIGEAKAGPAGFAKGHAVVMLAAEESSITMLSYQIESEIGGKIIRLGSHLVVATVKKLSNRFFTSLNAHFAGQASTKA